MSLERLALRLATVMALTNGFVAPYPTMAGARVYDSRIDAVQVADEDEVLPLITVCTDDDNGSPLSANNGGPPFERSVTLSIDIALGIPTTDDGAAALSHLATESELEMRLDIFEAEVERVLTLRSGVWGGELDKLARRITSYASVRYVERDGNVRLAARQIQMSVMLPLAKSAAVTMYSGAAPAPVPAVPAPLGPLLTAIVSAGGPYAADAQRIIDLVTASQTGAPVLMPRLDRIRLIEVPEDRRPDGVAEVTPPAS